MSKNLFEELMSDEEGHIDYLETQIDLVDRIGEQNWNQLNAKPTDEVEVAGLLAPAARRPYARGGGQDRVRA